MPLRGESTFTMVPGTVTGYELVFSTEIPTRTRTLMDPDIPYLLLTPGPLTTSRTVKEAMLADYCTWDDDYNSLITRTRNRLVDLSGGSRKEYTAVLMQGSGTFAVEATIGSVVPPQGKLLVVDNGAYGARITKIADYLKIAAHVIRQSEIEAADLNRMEEVLNTDPAITHIAVVHCETTTGMLNPAKEVGDLARRYGKTYILDAMSSFGGIPMSIPDIGAHYLVSSANKCIQGVPGFGFIICHRPTFEPTKGFARSLSLDIYDQWYEMEHKGGKWRFTSPTHVVRAFIQAMDELEAEGGIPARHARYRENQRLLSEGMRRIGFKPLLDDAIQSPFITAFHYPKDPGFAFLPFYEAMKKRRFVLYPGKVSHADTFRVGTIGQVFPEDIELLLKTIEDVVAETGWEL